MEQRTVKPLPKSQAELSQNSIEPLLPGIKTPYQDLKKREFQISTKDSDVKQLTVGLEDIDKAIFYYFENVIRPEVVQNGSPIQVPIVYGSPERWSAVQKQGMLRDKNGKLLVPLIMIKRESLEKNRNLGNKLDANLPVHFGIFEKKYSAKNIYDNFAALTNRVPVREYYGVIMPDYVTLTYKCILFTDFVEQMNKLVEAINFASDAYWGDPDKFKFRVWIDSYSTAVELQDKQDRAVKTTFDIKLAGYIIPDTVNASIKTPNRHFSKAAVKFTTETDYSADSLQ